MDDFFTLPAGTPGGARLYAGWNKLPPPAEGFADGDAAGTLDMTNFVWTPGRNDAGLVTNASVATLPLNVWFKVAGTQLTQITTLLSQAVPPWSFTAYDRGAGKTPNRTMNPWVGCAFDQNMKIYYPRGGGHGDSSVNGTWSFDLTTMRWGIVNMPSYPDKPGFEWNAGYPFSAQPGSFYYASTTAYSWPTGFEDSVSYPDILPDGKPTSVHTYNGVWYDSKRHQVGTSRPSKWVLDLTSNTWTRTRWSYGSDTPMEFKIRAQIYYYAPKDCLYGNPGSSDADSSFAKCPQPGARWYGLANKPPTFNYNTMSSLRLSDDELLFFWNANNNSERWGIFNMATETWRAGSGGSVVNGRVSSLASDGQACILVPTWGTAGQVIRRGAEHSLNGQWWRYDIATNTNLEYPRAATVGVEYARLGAAFSTYYTQQPMNKWLAIPKAGMCMMLDDGSGHTGNAVMVMRYR